jgi:hypothetical protein
MRGFYYVAIAWLCAMAGLLIVAVVAGLSGCATQPRDGISQREAIAITQILRKDLSNDR